MDGDARGLQRPGLVDVLAALEGDEMAAARAADAADAGGV